MKGSGDFEILHEIVRDTTRKSENHELIRVVSQTIACTISKSPLHFIFFFTVYMLYILQYTEYSIART